MFDAVVRADGPLFDGRAGRALVDFTDAVERHTADVVADRVRQIVSASARESTGYYRDRVTSEPRGRSWSASDDGVAYGPWLEGVASRNQRSDFKGWQAWRRARQEAERRLAGIADQEWKVYKGRME